MNGLIILRNDQVIYADMAAARLLGLSLELINRAGVNDILERLAQPDRERLMEALAAVDGGEPAVTLERICLGDDETTGSLDALVDMTLYQGNRAQRLVWMERPAPHHTEERLRQHIDRLQILHEIDQSILSIQDESATAAVALSRIGSFVSGYLASSVILVDDVTRPQAEARLLAYHPESRPEFWGGKIIPLDGLALDFSALLDGLPCIQHDLSEAEALLPAQQRMLAGGARSSLATPLRGGGNLVGVLMLTSSKAHVFGAELVQIAQEVADSLAVAIREARLRRDERRRQQESQVMRDVMASLASASDLSQTLQALMVNLHNLIAYDRAGLFLVDEDEGLARGHLLDSGLARAPEASPLVAEMRATRWPIVAADIRDDTRFLGWADVESVRGWLGAPLLAGDRLIGFISLGALTPGAYDQSDAETMHMFAAEVSQVLERAWLDEQAQRRTQELEVLSNITTALGQVEGGRDSLAVILAQVAEFFDADRGALLVHDPARNGLTIKAALEPELVGAFHPEGDDLLWTVFYSGQLQVVSDTSEITQPADLPIYRNLFTSRGSGAVIPLASFDVVFGLLALAFDETRRFSPQTTTLFHTVAEIAGASLRRAVALEALEKQVAIRTQHLSTLYRINAIAAEPTPLDLLLESVLEAGLSAMKGAAGFIHLLDTRARRLGLAAGSGLSPENLAVIETLSLDNPFWAELAHSPNPLVLPDISDSNPPRERPRAATELRALASQERKAFIGAPIRVKSESLGVIGLLGETILNYTIEDITLFTAIADQIGGMVERARLAQQAGLAAVVQERQRLARELHDSVTQLLYSQVLFSGASLKVLRQGNVDLAQQHLTRIESAAQQALKEMRLLVYELRPSDDLDDGLAGALERRLEAVEKRTGINARLIVTGDLQTDQATAMALYRIAEEALNNTLKHAAASNVLVTLQGDDTQILLEISDDGVGFDPNAPHRGGMGLENMRERVAGLGGNFEIITLPGTGARVLVRVQKPVATI